MHIYIAGGTGFIGSKLAQHLMARGHQVTVIGQHQPRQNQSAANALHAPRFLSANLMQSIPDGFFDGADAVVNLVGKSIFGRFTAAHKKDIYHSRIISTRNIAQAIGNMQHKPAVFVSASAVGYYGDCGTRLITEKMSAGTSFLARLCADWEAAAYGTYRESPADAQPTGSPNDVRTVIVRTANVIGNGGLLGVLGPLFRYGLGGTLGNGRQYMPLIHLDDMVAVYTAAIEQDSFSGPINASMPVCPTNVIFTKELGKRVHRPAFWRIPRWALRLVFASFADEIVANQHVVPSVLSANHFQFLYPDIAQALAATDV